MYLLISIFLLANINVLKLVLCTDFEYYDQFSKIMQSDPDENEVLLLQTDTDHSHEYINAIFYNNYINLFRERHLELYKIQMSHSFELNNFLEIQRSPYVINLYVKDFYKYNYNTNINRITYAGDIENEPEKPIWRLDFKANDINETIKEFKEINKFVKIVSRRLMEDHPPIFDAVLNFRANETKKGFKPHLRHSITVCDSNKIHFSHAYKFKVKHYQENCNATDGSIAIVTDKHFEVIERVDKPTVFLNEYYLTPEVRSDFANGITLPLDNMKYAYLYFLTLMKWNRVAIISDDSEFSEEFGRQLTSLFEENGVVFISETCVTSDCDFNEILKKLKTYEARVIIANMDEKYSTIIAKLAEQNGLMISNSVVWIFRDWSIDQAKEAAKKIGQVFTIQFSNQNFYISNKYSHSSEYKDKIQVVLDIINNIITKFYHSRKNKNNYVKDKECTTEQLEIKIKDQIKKLLATATYKCVIMAVQSLGHTHLTTELLISKGIIEPVDFDPPFSMNDYGVCIVKTNSFYKPCADIYILYIMLAIAVFVLAILVVVIVFKKSSIPYRRMNS